MRVTFQVSGGVGFFPGLAAPRTFDVQTLPELTRRRLANLIDESEFFSLPSPPPPAGAADYQTYRITVEDDTRRHTVVVSDPVASAPLQGLIDMLQNL
jgi:hypothetical protein